MKRAGILIYLSSFLFWFMCCMCCCGSESEAYESGCMVICEVPEEPVRYEIPKIKGKGFYYLEEEKIIYTTIYGGLE